MPLQHYLKQFFAADKKYGSKDRKHISQLCYCYFRIGHALTALPVEERMQVAVFLCNEPPAWNNIFPEDWQQYYVPDLDKRITFIQEKYPAFSPAQIFPWAGECSAGLDTAAFTRSLLMQPDVFIRIRPGFEKRVPEVLTQNNISYTQPYKGAIALLPNTKIDSLLKLNREVVIQDLSSQKTANLLLHLKQNQSVQQRAAQQPVNVWDCCAASGGKSILALDTLGKINLTVSDVRLSIIQNLRQRFQEAGIKHFRSFVADLTKPIPNKSSLLPSIIICDAPCSGSGTWGRAPEQLYFFTKEKISHYANLQTKISDAVVAQLVSGGYLLYITCSVFKQENEVQVQRIMDIHGLTLIEQQLITGYSEKADTMFAALLVK
ncbi:Fmu (Sun) domain protein [Filimonas effusa]|uniref:Fmu (Sun) domain protein n=2 Tax=Filimonas effusa TaxID=2508721 RepID=A0A4Q1DEX5_9BACT|nr:Fmu (Sun) domain protein [Filimonas effusa]